MDRRPVRKAVSALLCILIVFASVPGAFAEGEDKAEDTENKYKPGEVIVLFSDDAVKDSGDSLKKARAIPEVSRSFGLSLTASGSEEEAAFDARSEADILGEILGDDFVLEDSLVFADEKTSGESSGLKLNSDEKDGISVALVSSEKYDTEEMIKKLGKSDKIAAAEPNYYVRPADISGYTADDTYNKYLYQLNSPKAQNKGGESVADRGTDPEKALSVNAASVWDKETSEEETVVAVLDTGVLDTHEDLQGSMWENPGNIGLKGEHGYNFYDNNEDSGFDDIGHGTHCAGIIAAQMNNGTGTAGVAGNKNIKIMALKFMGNHQPATIYQAYGAFSYALKAKQMGVNVAATSNSWSGEGEETAIYDAIIDKLGEAGIINFIAAGNYSMDIDRETLIPSTSNSEYTVVVGAADITGKPAPFSDFGKNTVDLFAPGENILSTVGYDSYLPSIYTAEELTRTTEYYGEFSEDTVIEDGAVTPERGDRAGEIVKAFGKSEFRKQPSYMHEEGTEIPDDARLELSIDSGGRYFSPDHPARLKFTIKNAQYGEEYYLYFPYAKNRLTTGDKDTKFSIVYESTAGDKGGSASVMGGEVYEEDGKLMLYGGGIYGYGIDETEDSVMTHCNNYLNESMEEEEPEDPDGEEYPDYSNRIMSYEEAEGRSVGIGLQVTHDLSWKKGESHDLTLYIESIGVSDPEVKIESTSSYEIASGTSMACPAAAGAGALLASLDPMKEGENGAEYVRRLKSRLFSCVTAADELKDLCSTGGYIDLSQIDAKKPAVSDAVCSADTGTITLKGENLYGCTVSYKRLAVEGSEETELPSGGMKVSWSRDGKSIKISGAKELIGTYTAFTVTDASGRKTESKFFLVRGLKKFKKIAEKRGMAVETRDPYPYYVSLVTDKDGKELYGYDMNSGVVARFNGRYFDEIQSTNLEYNALDWLEEQGDKYSVFNDVYQIETFYSENLGHGPLQDNGKLYQMANITMEDGSAKLLFAVLDLSKDPLKWEFSEFAGFPDYLLDRTGHVNGDYTALDGKIYYTGNLTVGADETNVFACYDIEKNEWERLADLPDNTTRQPQLYAAYGKVYYMFGHDVSLPAGSLGEGLMNHVWCYDTEKDEWEKKDDIPFIGKFGDWDGYAMHFERAALAENGLVFPNTSVDGAGSCFLYNTETYKCEPMYCTVTESLSDTMLYQSCAATRDGIYYIRFVEDELMSGYDLYFLSAKEGAYRSRFAGLSRKKASLKAGKELKLKVISGKAKSWKSSNKKVCTVKNGRVTALRKGTATITATLTSGQKVKCRIKVTTSPKLSKKTITVRKGGTKTIKITGKAKTVKNKYRNTAKAKIMSKKTASKIKVKGLKKGTTILTIRVNGVALDLMVKVR